CANFCLLIWRITILREPIYLWTRDTPVPRAIQAIGAIHANQIPGGLHHQYVRISLTTGTAWESRRSIAVRTRANPRGAQDFSLSPARREDRTAQSRLGNGHKLHPDAARLRPPCGGRRRVQPAGAGAPGVMPLMQGQPFMTRLRANMCSTCDAVYNGS